MSRLGVIFVCAFACAGTAIAHNVPVQLPEPQSAAEAWNVIEESAANVDKLFEQGLARDVTFQLANSATALQWLGAQGGDNAGGKELTDQLTARAAEIITAIQSHSQSLDQTKPTWKSYRAALADLERQFPRATVESPVYICSMHPLDRHIKADDRCSICHMALVRRHLAASGVYEAPGEPTMTMRVVAPSLVVGKPSEVRIQLAKRGGAPVRMDDLLDVHTRKIHLLINDRSLGDYHHEHPEPTGTPGEYAFKFTPTRPGSYRIWADVVPTDTGVQEYVTADTVAPTAPLPLSDRAPVSTVTVNGREYVLGFEAKGQPLRAGETAVGTLTVTSPDGKPFNQLEPVMGAFAHIVGFNEDLKTVVHIHPVGAEPKHPQDRGGPAFAFKFYPPAPGFYRLYAQVQINGAQQFAPFALTVLP
jgi:hypothetical protein